jgi:hypothetical protein
MEKTLNGTKRRMGLNVEWKTLTIKIVDIVEWKKRRMGQNVEWKTYIED